MSSVHPSDPIWPPDYDGDSRPEPFELRIEPMGKGWIRVLVEGELALTSAGELERAVERELVADKDVLLDFSEVTFIDSFGLRAMTALVRVAKDKGRELKLSSDLPAHARRLMEIVGLLPFVPIDQTSSEIGANGD